MCEAARKEWGEQVFKDADLIVVSPMMRALQTAFIIAGKNADDSRWLVSPMCSEHLSGATCDEGRPKSELVKAIPWMSAWKGVEELDEEWWKAPRPEEPLRVAAFLAFLQKRPEQKIIVVSHGGFLEYIAGFYMQNAEHHIMSQDDARQVDKAMHTASFNICEALSKESASYSFKALEKASLTCFHGLGRRSAGLLQQLGLKNVTALAEWKFAKWAEALCVLAATSRAGARDLSHEKNSMNVNKAFVKEWEGYSVADLLEAPISAMSGISEAHQKTLNSLGLRCIKDLGTWKYFLWARSICALAGVESGGSRSRSRSRGKS